MIEVELAVGSEQALQECLSRGLVVRSARELAGRPGSRHYHLSYPDKPGTLELSEWQGRAWLSVNERRDCGWVSGFARDVAGTVAGVVAGQAGSLPAGHDPA